MPSNVLLTLVVVGLGGAVVAFLLLSSLVNLYIQALLTNTHIPFIELIGMRLRGSDMRTIVLNRIRSRKAGLEIPVSALETHALAGGRLTDTVSAMIGARTAGRDLSWEAACTHDLAALHGDRSARWSADQRPSH